jgi:hypothetical protein
MSASVHPRDMGERFRRAYGLLAVLLIALTALSYAQASVNQRDVARLFIAAANRGDYMTACGLYSRRYLKVSRAECARFYHWGRRLYGPYDYREVSRHKLGDKTRVELTHFACRSQSYIDVQAGKIVGGGW